MTSKNSYSDSQGERRLAAKLVKEKMRHSLWALSLFTLLLFFTMTLPTAMAVQQLMARRSIYDWTQQQLVEQGVDTVSGILGLSNGFTALAVANMALVMAAVCFRYLHNKNQVDFYHSLPIRRPYLFAANFCAGFAGFLIAYFGNLLLSALIAVCAGFGGALITAAMGAAILYHCVFFLVVYAICILGHQLAGVTATGVLCSGVLLAGPLAAFGLFVAYAQSMFLNFYLPESILFRIGDCCSPLWAYISRCFRNTEAYAGQIPWMGAAFGWLLVGVAIVALACWAYCRRPSEVAGKAASFRLPASVLKYFAVLLCTLAGGMLFRMLIGGQGWMVFGFCLAGLLSHCLVEIIYHLDFKALFCHIRAFGLFALVFAAAYLCLELDIMGYDAYLPSKDQVKAVSVNLDWLDYAYRDNRYVFYSGQDFELEQLNKQTYRQPDTMEAALKLCEISLNPYGISQDSYYSTEVRYTLKSGRQVYRQYLVPKEGTVEQLIALYDSQEYQQNYNPLYRKEPAEFQSVLITLSLPNREEQYLRQPGQAEKIAQALRQDIEQNQSQNNINKGPLAQLSLSTDPNYGKEGHYGDKDSFEASVPIYDTYTNTLAQLHQMGIVTEDPLRPEEIEEAWLWVEPKDGESGPSSVATQYSHGTTTVITETRAAKGDEILLTDWKDIQPLLEKAIPDHLSRRNPFFIRDTGIRLRVVLDKNSGKQVEFIFPKEN